MIAKVELTFNTHTKRILMTMIEGIEFTQQNYKKPSASSAKWTLKVKINVSPDKTVDIAGMLVGRPLHDADGKIKVTYRKSNQEKTITENLEDDTFSKKMGVVLFKKEIQLV